MEELDLLAVVLGRLAREAVEEVPERLHAVLLAPLQQLDVRERRRTLAHQVEHVVVEALDPRLDPDHAGVAQVADVLRREVRLDLPEELEPEIGLGEHREHRLEVAHVEDVVDDAERTDAVAVAEVRELVDDTLGALAAKRHRRAVQPAERAVRPLAPPAARAPSRRAASASRRPRRWRSAARRTRRNPGTARRRAARRSSPSRARAAAVAAAVTPAIPSSGSPAAAPRAPRGTTGRPRRRTRGRRTGTAASSATPIASSQFAPPNAIVTSGTTLLDPRRERERRDVLLEHRREADERCLLPRDDARGSRRGTTRRARAPA